MGNGGYHLPEKFNIYTGLGSEVNKCTQKLSEEPSWEASTYMMKTW